MKVLLGMLLVGIMASSAFAVVDEDADMMGIYFDLNADVVCNVHIIGVPFDAYIMYTNPTVGGCGGFECNVAPTPGIVVNLESYPVPTVDVGTDTATSKDFVAGFSAIVPTTPATVLCTLNLTAYIPSGYFQLGPSLTPSNGVGLPMVLDDSPTPIALLVGFSTLDGVNAARTDAAAGVCDIVPAEEASWGSIKSLYR